MDRETKVKALFASALAFADRGEWLQYDQLSLDRVDTVSARRQDFAPPEAATEQRRLFLDCSAFVWDCFYQTFDYMLEADLTWHMIDRVTPRIYYREWTHREAEEELAQVRQELQALLQPGDVIVFSNENGNGHAMLYMNEEQYINCSTHGTFNGYHYQENRNVFTRTGGIYIESVHDLLWMCSDPVRNRNCLFKPDKARFSVHRPLDLVGDPMPDAMARIGRAAGLKVSVLTNYPGGRTAEPGAELEYRVDIVNQNAFPVSAEVGFAPGCGSCGASRRTQTEIPAGAERTVVFTASAGCGETAGVPEVVVNGLHAAAPDILLGPAPDEEAVRDVVRCAAGAIAAGADPQEAIGRAYAGRGINVCPLAAQSLRRLFFLHDSLRGDVLSRRKQDPFRDMCVRTYFGGRGVVTPEVCSRFGVRTVSISRDDLMPGDIVCFADGAGFENASEVLWTGETFLGTDMEPEAFTESLFGRFVFALLRPSLVRKQN